MKQEYVIDANILFNAFISGKDIYLLLFSKNKICVPDFAFSELEKYKKRILLKTKLKEKDFSKYALRLLKEVTVIPNLMLSEKSLKKAYELCRETDEKDTVYVAAALEFELTLITSDRRLYEGLRARHFYRVALLGDVMNQFLKNGNERTL